MNASRDFLFVGNGPYLNHGCEAIVRGTMAILRATFGDELSCVNACFGDSARLRKQQTEETDPAIRSISIDKPNWSTRGLCARVIRRLHISVPDRLSALTPYLKTALAALKLGGDNYSLSYGLWVLRRYVDLDLYLMDHGIPAVLWGASVGPFSEDAEVEQMMTSHLRKLDLILARETTTLAYLKSIGVEANVRLVADPAFVMEPVEPELPAGTRDLLKNGAIGVNISPMAGQYGGGDLSEWTRFASECIDALLGSGLGPVILVPHVMVPSHNDHEFMSQAAAHLGDHADRLAVLPPDLSAAQYKWVIGRLRAVVAARTHATIAGFSTAVPTLSIGYSVKAAGINQDIYGHTNWCLPVAELTADLLVSRMKEIISDENEIRRHLTEVSSEMRKRAMEAGEHLAAAIGVRAA